MNSDNLCALTIKSDTGQWTAFAILAMFCFAPSPPSNQHVLHFPPKYPSFKYCSFSLFHIFYLATSWCNKDVLFTLLALNSSEFILATTSELGVHRHSHSTHLHIGQNKRMLHPSYTWESHWRHQCDICSFISRVKQIGTANWRNPVKKGFLLCK